MNAGQPAAITATRATVDLLWIPLGAGQRVVRSSGRAYESLTALFHGRTASDLYHSALVVTVPSGHYAIEMAPIRDRNGADRGVVAEGPVGMHWLGRFMLFRYEIRRWRNGVIPDAGEAVSTVRFEVDLAVAERLLGLVEHVPTLVWGRDELRTGEMWNSNSVTAWLLTYGGIVTELIDPPTGGRAPGWDAGLAAAAVVAKRPEIPLAVAELDAQNA